MQNTLPNSTEHQEQHPAPTTLMTLQQCTEIKQAFNNLVKIEQSLTISQSIEQSPLIVSEGRKLDVLPQIIRVIEFFLAVTGKEMENFQIQILAGDLYEKFKTDTIDDVVLMFKMARQAEFGKMYSFDAMVVNDWANKYLEVKSATREKLLKKKAQPRIESETEKGKYFHELPAEIQEKFKKIGKPKEEQAFLTPRITEMMTSEKHKRDIQKLIDEDEKP
ncbi:MAG: hypothetical protein J0I53_07660 [Chryseobacterium sp.]|nr:hypothetical protein [Chryseobacterium sp.]